MIREFNFRITPEQLHDQKLLYELVRKELPDEDLRHVEVVKRSIDARKPDIRYNVKVAAYLAEDFIPEKAFYQADSVTKNSPEVVIVGSGPAGLFAALRALQLGLKPVVLERGKDVRSRRRDLAKITKEQFVDPDSNYCFGEGGAGTYSDGKLYTRSKKRGDVNKILEWFVHFGAERSILVDAHPHIGTNKLPGIIQNIREAIISKGGEIRFQSKLTDIFVGDGSMSGVEINGSQKYPAKHLILATGHSARDIFQLLKDKEIRIEAKPFALGVRIEHPQELIDKIQYHGRLNDEFLPPATYSLATQVDGVGVHSFCMCPGGIVAPCATEQNEVVTNGWSPSRRNNPYANSGVVVQLKPEDLGDPEDPFVCLNFQKQVEANCWEAAGKTQKVPAQRLLDFLQAKVSEDLPKTSYQAGLTSVDLNKVLPGMIIEPLKKAFRQFGKKMKGYLTNEAVLHAPESRTSSPIRIPRDKKTFQHPEISGFFPCGEGAGYAGGIVSAAVDGIKCVEAIEELTH